MSHVLETERKILNSINLDLRYQIKLGEKYALRHKLVNSINDALNAINRMMILVKVNKPNLARQHVFGALN